MKSWTCNMSIKEILEFDFVNKISNENNILINFDYKKEECILDLILCDLPVKNICIFKYDSKIDIDNSSLISFLNLYLNNLIKIKGDCTLIHDEIRGKKFHELNEQHKDKIINYLFTCNIISFIGTNEKDVENIITKYKYIDS